MKFKLVEELINEDTSRLYRNLTDNNYTCAIISAYVSDNETTEEENERNLTKLKADVRSIRLGFSEFISAWTYNGERFDERSLLIGNIDLNTAITLGQKYNQYSIIYKDNNGCFEICTKPFNSYNIGDKVRKFNITGTHILNISDAQQIFSKRLGGAASMPVKGSNKKPFTLKQVESFTLCKVIQPSPSVFCNEFRYITIQLEE